MDSLTSSKAMHASSRWFWVCGGFSGSPSGSFSQSSGAQEGHVIDVFLLLYLSLKFPLMPFTIPLDIRSLILTLSKSSSKKYFFLSNCSFDTVSQSIFLYFSRRFSRSCFVLFRIYSFTFFFQILFVVLWGSRPRFLKWSSRSFTKLGRSLLVSCASITSLARESNGRFFRWK